MVNVFAVPFFPWPHASLLDYFYDDEKKVGQKAEMRKAKIIKVFGTIILMWFGNFLFFSFVPLR